MDPSPVLLLSRFLTHLAWSPTSAVSCSTLCSSQAHVALRLHPTWHFAPTPRRACLRLQPRPCFAYFLP